MGINFIQANNFRSFKEINQKLGNFNIIVGANASGKSNFLQIFQFLRDIATKDFNNAISLQGGSQYLRNINQLSCDELFLKVGFDFPGPKMAFEKKGHYLGITFGETEYSLEIKFKKSRQGYTILKDEIKFQGNAFELEKIKSKPNKSQKRKEKNDYEQKEKLGEVTIVQSKQNGKIKFSLKKYKDFNFELSDLVPEVFEDLDLPENISILGFPFFPPLINRQFEKISIYDFDPKLPKKASPITGQSDLEEDGSNLAIVVQNIIEESVNKRKLLGITRDLIPVIDDINVEKFTDKSILFKLREAYSKHHYLPASLISDGTINVIALIIALYFEKSKLAIIEEPERNIHPYLIAKVVDLMRDASSRKQIIVTTHNPEIVRHAGLETLYLISRDSCGFSQMSQPKNSKDVKVFLENEIGVDELFVQNLLKI